MTTPATITLWRCGCGGTGKLIIPVPVDAAGIRYRRRPGGSVRSEMVAMRKEVDCYKCDGVGWVLPWVFSEGWANPHCEIKRVPDGHRLVVSAEATAARRHCSTELKMLSMMRGGGR